MSTMWASLLLSGEIALAATVVTCVVGVPLAFGMSRRRFVGKSVVEALILVPLVLPPTVVGYVILMVLGRHGVVGRWFFEMWEYTVIFRFEGAVMAAAVVALPMLYMPAKAAFEGVDRELEDVSRLFGATRWQMFWHVSLPLARRGIGSGLVLAFARALGEFGATVMVYGWQPGRTTLPISVYADFTSGELVNATPAVVALGVMSVVLIMGYNRWGRA